MMRRASRAALPLLLLLAALLPACLKKKPAGPPPPPPKVVLREHVFLRESASDNSPVVEELDKGATVSVDKLTSKWGHVVAADGKAGYVHRESFSVRVALFGTASFPYTAYVADRLRQVPVLDLVSVETTSRIMPGSPAGGVDGAIQLGKPLKVDLVIGVTGAGRQFVYEVVDLKNERVIATGMTHEAALIRVAVNEIADVSVNAIGPLVNPAGTPAPGTSPSPTPTPTPEPRHPNAPLPLDPVPSATPAATATATP